MRFPIWESPLISFDNFVIIILKMKKKKKNVSHLKVSPPSHFSFNLKIEC